MTAGRPLLDTPLGLDDLARACRRVEQAWWRHQAWRQARGEVPWKDMDLLGVDAWMHDDLGKAIQHLFRLVGVPECDLLLWFGEDDGPQGPPDAP